MSIVKEEKKRYSAAFILDTRDYKDSVETLIERITTVINNAGGKVIKVENLGQRSFERVVNRKFPAGIYVDFTYEGSSKTPGIVREKLHLDKNIHRIYITSQ